MKILHFITGFNYGETEGISYRLCKKDTKHEHIVIFYLYKFF
jgi:hypothetical protein